jgi:FdhD protein
MDQLFHVQELYRQSRGIHCSALSDGSSLLVHAEDIGRHNTLDKLAGQLLLEPVEFQPRIIFSTGRISSEMLQKSARLGASIVVSRTAASSMAIELAQQYGITLIGYARRASFNVYTHPGRLEGAPIELLDHSPQALKD